MTPRVRLNYSPEIPPMQTGPRQRVHDRSCVPLSNPGEMRPKKASHLGPTQRSPVFDPENAVSSAITFMHPEGRRAGASRRLICSEVCGGWTFAAGRRMGFHAAAPRPWARAAAPLQSTTQTALCLKLPAQPPPRIRAEQLAEPPPRSGAAQPPELPGTELNL